MSPKGQPTTMEERVYIAERSSAGESSREIARALGRPLSTVRKWRQRYQRAERAGLVSKLGRPAGGALAQFPAAMKTALLALRTQHPGWGPVTLRLELAHDARFTGHKLPSRSRIAAYLKAQQQVRKYERHRELPEPDPQPVQRPHQEWELDAQGVTPIAGLGHVSVINVLDRYSHLSIDSHACLQTRHPNAAAYQQLLRRAFLRYGLPESITLDHDSAFFDNKSASPFPSRIPLWLLALGVQVRFIHKPPPLEHAHIERHHQTIARQAFAGQTFTALPELQRSLQTRLQFLNHTYPTQALNDRSPLQVCPQARHSSRVYQPQAAAKLLKLQRIYDYLQAARWFRKVSTVGTFSLGGYRYNAASHLAGQTLEITFHPESCQLQCRPENGADMLQIAIQGLTKAALMGSVVDLPSYLPFQLPLPLVYPNTTL